MNSSCVCPYKNICGDMIFVWLFVSLHILKWKCQQGDNILVLTGSKWCCQHNKWSPEQPVGTKWEKLHLCLSVEKRYIKKKCNVCHIVIHIALCLNCVWHKCYRAWFPSFLCMLFACLGRCWYFMLSPPEGKPWLFMINIITMTS